MANQQRGKVAWRLPAGAALGGILLIVVNLLIAGAGLLWDLAEIGPGNAITISGILLWITAGLAVVALLLLLAGVFRKRLGPMRLGAVLSLVPAVIVITRPSDPWWVSVAVLGAAIIGVMLVFTAPRPKNLVYA